MHKNTSIFLQIKSNYRNYTRSLTYAGCSLVVCCICCHFLTQWSTKSSESLSDSSSVMIHDLHTLLHKNTHLHKQIISWHAGSRSGCTRSVPVALDRQADGFHGAKLKTKGPLSVEKPLQAPLKEQESERKAENKNDVCNRVPITLKMSLPPAPCLCAAPCQPHEGCLTVLNNWRATHMRRQMGQRWWSTRCHCEPAEGKEENLRSICKLLDVELPGWGGGFLPPHPAPLNTHTHTQNHRTRSRKDCLLTFTKVQLTGWQLKIQCFQRRTFTKFSFPLPLYWYSFSIPSPSITQQPGEPCLE